jgi:hypothetical protein
MQRLLEKVVHHKDGRISVRQSLWDNKSQQEFIATILALIPNDCSVAKYKSGMYSVPSMLPGTYTGRTLVTMKITMVDTEQSSKVSKVLKDLLRNQQ